MTERGGDEMEFEHADARNEERVRRIKAARRLAQVWNWSVRVDELEDAEPARLCCECGCALEWCRGTGCSVCGARICAVCTAERLTNAVGGHEIEVPPLRCRQCEVQEAEA